MNKSNKLLLFFISALLSILEIQHQQIVWADNKQEIQIIEQQALDLYQQNRYTEAIDLLATAIDQYQRQGDMVGSAIAIRNLALIYQKLGQWQQADITLNKAQAIIATIDNEAEKNQLLAQILEVQGQIEISLGQRQAALATWKKATALYQQQDNITGFTQGKIYQAYALQTLGLYSQSIKTLTRVNQELVNKPDTLIKAQALLNIGNILNRVGRYEEAQNALKSSLAIAQKLESKSTIANTLLSLGKNARLQAQPEQALELYQQAIEVSPQSDMLLRGKLEQLDVLVYLQKTENAINLAAEIEGLLAELPLQQTTIESKISLARNLLTLDTKPQKIIKLLVSAIQQAQNLGLKRTEAEALGVLGNIYELHQEWQSAQIITEQALLITQGINAKELTYQWQWQLGRILKAQGKTSEAIVAYTQATENLQALRGDIVAISSDLQYSFSSEIEPVYRELAILLLQPEASQADLNQARQVIESLQLAELDNFFRDACLDIQPVQIDRLDPTAAIIYTIILGNRLEIISAIPGQPLRYYSQEIPPSELEIVITSANNQINKPRRVNFDTLQQAYDWLIRPLEADIKASKIETLVFVPDGILRNLPPAVLHDGEQYLVEKYNIAIAPSLQLVELQAREDNRQELLLAGLSQPRQGFSSLPGVKKEIEQIEPLFPSEVLLNESFTEFNFINFTSETPFRVVHLATHGQFSSNAEDTFVLTWDDRINIDELSLLLRGDSKQLRPIDLLVLSACETATGDRLAALGLAGIAVRAGARSTIASLWAVSDEATVTLMTNFYQELSQGNVTKAEALRRAQISILNQEKFSHPFYWSAFILVGNWK
ncbi:MAG: CHAT domain-containing protein [Xenococcaceae cyanobacterium MO_188.B29]|nr:CHAT domain-containing protein [Xenococcaceae cyanobacterium MO_188.B29]